MADRKKSRRWFLFRWLPVPQPNVTKPEFWFRVFLCFARQRGSLFSRSRRFDQIFVRHACHTAQLEARLSRPLAHKMLSAIFRVYTFFLGFLYPA